jgi:hypothetical protein
MVEKDMVFGHESQRTGSAEPADEIPDEDFCYPVPREADDIYSAPSDGGSYWRYSGFNHY